MPSMAGIFSSIGTGFGLDGFGAAFYRFFKRMGCVFDAKRHSVGAGAMLIAKDIRLTGLFAVQEKIDISLAIVNDVF